PHPCPAGQRGAPGRKERRHPSRAAFARAGWNPRRGWQLDWRGAEQRRYSHQRLLQLWPVWSQCRLSPTRNFRSREFPNAAATKSQRLIHCEPSMLRLLEAGLIVAVCVAVLAFGGTAPSFFAVTQVIIFGLGVVFLLSRQSSRDTSFHIPIACPLLLVALVLLQLCPLPVSLAPMFGRVRDELPSGSYFIISMERYQTVSHLLLLVTYLTAFFLTLFLCRDRNAKKRLVFALVSLGAFEALYGLIQFLTGWQQIFAYVKKYYLEEATGTYINRNHFAGFLEMILPFAMVLALRWTHLLSKNASDGRAGTFRKIVSRTELVSVVFWLFLAILISAALVLSRSRMGIISALVSLVAVLALAGTSAVRPRTRVAVAALFFLGVLGLIVWIGSDPVMSRFETLGQE